MDLVHCIYCSAATSPVVTRSDLDALLARSRSNNASLGITGILLFHEGIFFQVLEGDRPAVESLYARIEGDPRHTRVTRLIIEPIEARSFSEWSMGFSQITPEDLAEIPGLNNFLTTGESLFTMTPGRAQSLLRAFKEGRWRLMLS